MILCHGHQISLLSNWYHLDALIIFFFFTQSTLYRFTADVASSQCRSPGPVPAPTPAAGFQHPQWHHAPRHGRQDNHTEKTAAPTRTHSENDLHASIDAASPLLSSGAHRLVDQLLFLPLCPRDKADGMAAAYQIGSPL